MEAGLYYLKLQEIEKETNEVKEKSNKIDNEINSIKKDVEHNIKYLHNDDIEMHYFCSKHFLYVISSLKPMENETIFQCLKRTLDD